MQWIKIEYRLFVEGFIENQVTKYVIISITAVIEAGFEEQNQSIKHVGQVIIKAYTK